MKHANPSEFERPRSANPLRTATIVIYATLMLLAVTIPQSVENWLADMNGNPVEDTALRFCATCRSGPVSRRCTNVPGTFSSRFPARSPIRPYFAANSGRKTRKMTVV
jgi:hypothetical protein